MARSRLASVVVRLARLVLPVALMAALASPLLAGAGSVHPRAAGPHADDVALEAPSDLSVARMKPSVVIRWAHPGRGIIGFQVERATGSGDFVRIGTVAREARTFRDRDARGGVAYTYRVRAVAVGAASAYSNDVIVAVSASERR